MTLLSRQLWKLLIDKLSEPITNISFSLSHDLQPLSIIQSFARKIGKTKARQKLFNANRALVRPM